MSSLGEYSSLIDTALVIALALVVWGAYRELRSRLSSNPARRDA
jgi:hypothetical protein